MIQKTKFRRNRYLGVAAFSATLLLAGMHQRFVLDPTTASIEARHKADFITGDLQKQVVLDLENKTQEVSLGMDALLREKLQSLVADSQMRTPPPPPLPITHVYYKRAVPQ